MALAWEQKSQPDPRVVIFNPELQMRITWGS